MFSKTERSPLRPTHATKGRVRVRTLLLTRWVAIFGQLTALLVVNKILLFSFPMLPALATISASVLLNIWIITQHSLREWHHNESATKYLAFDIVQLAALLYLTGGLDNPFALLFLVPATISATILSLRSAICLGVLIVFSVSVLAFFHLPLPWNTMDFELPDIYSAAIWISLILGTLFLMFYAWRVAEEARRMSEALAVTQSALSKERELSALGSLAAAAAHELGTPLGTIGLITKELLRGQMPKSEMQIDLELLDGEVARCRRILASLAQNPSTDADPTVSQMAFDALITDLANRYSSENTQVMVEAKDTTNSLMVKRSPELVQGLGNLIENATEFAKSRVHLEYSWNEERVELSISDDGPGFAESIQDFLGDPYISTRPGSGRMGLGVFISKTLLERTNAHLHFFNQRDSLGAVVIIRWPRHIIEINNKDSNTSNLSVKRPN